MNERDDLARDELIAALHDEACAHNLGGPGDCEVRAERLAPLLAVREKAAADKAREEALRAAAAWLVVDGPPLGELLRREVEAWLRARADAVAATGEQHDTDETPCACGCGEASARFVIGTQVQHCTCVHQSGDITQRLHNPACPQHGKPQPETETGGAS